MAKPASELVQYLEKKFSADEVRRLVEAVDDTEELARDIDWEKPIPRLVRDVVPALERHDLLDEAFFSTLVRFRPRQEAEIRRIADRFGRAPEKKSERPEPIPAPLQVATAPFVVPFASKGAGLVGRDRALDEVRTRLLRPTPLTSAVVFTGVGGLGKTQLAAEYAHRHRADYPGGLFWLTMDAELAIPLQRLAEGAGWVHEHSEPVSKIAEAKLRLPSLDGALIVLDNVESEKVVLELFPKGARSHVILTSREPLQLPKFRQEVVSVRALDPDDTWLLLERESGRPLGTRRDEPWVTRFLAQLDGLPLAIELAGAYLRANEGIGVEEYAELLDREGLDAEVLSDPTVVNASATGHSADLRAALRVSTRLLETNPRLRAILEVLTWSGPSAMGRPLLARVLGVEETDLVSALGLGERLQLLRVEGERRYRLHRLVRLALREQLLMEDAVAYERARRMEAWFTERREEFRHLSVFEAEHGHLEAWEDLATTREWWREAAAFAWLQGYPAYHWGRMVEAHGIVGRAVGMCTKFNGVDPLLEGRILGDMATCESQCGTAARARCLGDRALALLRPFPGASREVARVSASVAMVLAGDNQPGQSEPYADEAVAAAGVVALGDSVRGWVAIGRSMLLRRAGRRQEALLTARFALEELVPVVGEDHPDVLGLHLEEGLAMPDPDEGLLVLLEARRRQVSSSPHDAIRLCVIESALRSLHSERAKGTPNRNARIPLWEAAAGHSRSATLLAERATGSRSERLAGARNNLAWDLWHLGEDTHNPRHYQEAVDVVEGALRDCPRNTHIYNNLRNLRASMIRANIRGVRFTDPDR